MSVPGDQPNTVPRARAGTIVNECEGIRERTDVDDSVTRALCSRARRRRSRGSCPRTWWTFSEGRGVDRGEGEALMDLSAFVGTLLDEQDGDVRREDIRGLSQAVVGGHGPTARGPVECLSEHCFTGERNWRTLNGSATDDGGRQPVRPATGPRLPCHTHRVRIVRAAHGTTPMGHAPK